MSTHELLSRSGLDSEQIAVVRAHLAQALASQAFAGSKRSQDFLRLIVEHALAGRYDSLRERVIGAEMFGRPIDYDTANDAVVRVKATEVRRRLARFNLETPEPTPVRIEIPSGGYEPKFHWHAARNSDVTEDSTAIGAVEGELATDPFASATPSGFDPNSAESPGLLRKLHFRVVLLAAVVGLFVVAGLGYLAFQRNRAAARPAIDSIAVLPIQNLTGDSQLDYLVDGMTDQLIMNLGEFSTLRVISRTSSMSYKGTRKTLPEIAGELHVDGVVEGSIRREGSRIQFAVQLVDARSDTRIWSHSYARDRAAMLDLESEVAGAIVDSFRVETPPRGGIGLSDLARSTPGRGNFTIKAKRPFVKATLEKPSAISKRRRPSRPISARFTAHWQLPMAGSATLGCSLTTTPFASNWPRRSWPCRSTTLWPKLTLRSGTLW